mmetsp:Transcript_29257/g.30369  ORF Transcript_29257/g.30369 Transcript_29257/m.30369 type:complete len:318 (-) Transcript_29257:26-979(-)
MNVTQQVSLIKQRAVFEKVCDFKIQNGYLLCPREDISSGAMYLVATTGEVFTFNEGSSELISSFSGEPYCICFDNGGYFYLSDMNTGFLYYKYGLSQESNLNIDQVLLKEYEGKPFLGISSMTYNTSDNVIYFTDSGKFEYGQCYPANGSLFSLDLDTKIITPILYECLSHPNDVAYDYSAKCIYVCETFANRITRVKTSSSGIKYSSVFYQFSGRLGPTSLAIDESGNIYVSRFEYSDNSESNYIDGLISVLSSGGVLIGELLVPRLPEISGLFISSKRKDSLYFTERGNTCVMKIKLSNFLADLDKQETKKNYTN